MAERRRARYAAPRRLRSVRSSWFPALRIAGGVGALAGGGLLAWGLDSAVEGVGPAPEVTGATVAATVPRADREGTPPAPSRDPLTKAGTKVDQRVPARGTGTFAVVPLASGLAPDPEAETYSVEIEGGLRINRAVVAQTVDAVLADRRGWRSEGHVLARTDADPDFRIIIASPKTTDAQCAPLETEGRVSCHNSQGNVVLNARRWVDGIPDYAGALVEYRTYLVNHEVGHHLGYSHQECGGEGTPAPVMMQQTYGLKGCARNAWPG